MATQPSDLQFFTSKSSPAVDLALSPIIALPAGLCRMLFKGFSDELLRQVKVHQGQSLMEI